MSITWGDPAGVRERCLCASPIPAPRHHGGTTEPAMLCRGCGCDLPDATQTFTISAPSEWAPRPAGSQSRLLYRKPKRSPDGARERKARRKRQSKARRKSRK